MAEYFFFLTMVFFLFEGLIEIIISLCGKRLNLIFGICRILQGIGFCISSILHLLSDHFFFKIPLVLFIIFIIWGIVLIKNYKYQYFEEKNSEKK